MQRRLKWQKVTVEMVQAKVEAKDVAGDRQATLGQVVIGHLPQAGHQEAAEGMVQQKVNNH